MTKGALLAALALTGCVQHTATLSSGATYVAMGSSFAAGPGLGQIKPDTPQRCSRSPFNYATLLAERLKLRLVDVSCGGATTAHILGPWSELPAQVDAVTAETRLVTITIGGNDLGYILNLFAASCDAARGFVMEGKAMACPPMRAPAADAYRKLEASLRAIVRQTRERAPQARIMFVQYLKLVPDVPCPASQLTAEGAMVTRAIGEQLARITAQVAADEGTDVVSANLLSRDHTPCDAQPWSVGPKPLGEGSNAPWHPNRAGMAAVADSLAASLRN